MAKKKFDYQFDDIRREDTPVSAAGFGDMVEEPDNPDEAFVEVDLEEEDTSKAVSVAKPAAADASAANGKDNTEMTSKDQRRQALQDRKAREKADRIEQDLEDGRAEFATEVNSLKKEVAELKAGNEVSSIDQEYGDRETRLTDEMETAMEAGDSKETARINSELIALNSEKQAKLAAAEASVSVIEDLDAEQNRSTENQPANKRASQFMRDNADWWSDPDHEETVDYAKKLDKKLVELGHNPNSDAYWTRFNHNFDKKYPDMRVKDPDDIEIDLDDDGGDTGNQGNRRRGKSHVRQPGGAGGTRRTENADDGNQSGSKVRLTTQHKANMVRFHLDPSNPEDCAAYAREVKANNDREARRA